MLRYLTEKSLAAQPITLMMFGLLFVIFASGVVAVDLAEGWRTGYFFTKNVLYFLLFVSVVNTPARLRMVLICILISLALLTLLAVLRFHDIINLANIKPMGDSGQSKYGDLVTIQRLTGSGFFGDPNELCMLLAAAVPLCLYFLMAERNLLFRAFSAMSLPVFGYAIYLTQSRGGFLAVVGGLGCLFWSRYGWRKTVLIGAIGLPLLLMVTGGRQTEISTSTGTAKHRVELWRMWFMVFRDNIVAGNGLYLPKGEQTADADVMVAHNSYLQCFADLGVVGGCLFLGAFITAVWSLHRFNARNCLHTNYDLKLLQPYVLASVVAYCIGMYSLSISFIVPTYLILGLAVSYTLMAQRSCLLAGSPLRIDNPRLLGTIAAAGLCFLIVIYLTINILK